MAWYDVVVKVIASSLQSRDLQELVLLMFVYQKNMILTYPLTDLGQAREFMRAGARWV